MDIIYGSGVALARICFSVFSKCKVEGTESIPPRGPLIVAANHLSNADPALVMASLNRRLYSLAKQGLFENPLTSIIMKGMGTHPVNREGNDLGALRWALNLLDQDKAILIFPEGKRSRNAALERSRPGIGYIALRSQAPVLPIAITGTENIPGMWRVAFPLCGITVKIGQPFTLPYIEGKLNRSLLQQASDIIMGRVSDLLPPSYRGFYGTTITTK